MNANVAKVALLIDTAAGAEVENVPAAAQAAVTGIAVTDAFEIVSTPLTQPGRLRTFSRIRGSPLCQAGGRLETREQFTMRELSTGRRAELDPPLILELVPDQLETLR